jgi:SSS family solute:Na+ symporter
MATIFGIAASVATAYVAAQFNNIMDVLQLVFAFVNAPLLATFLLGMFSKRTTGHGAFAGLLSGTTAAALHHGLTLPVGAAGGVKGGWIASLHTYPSEMAQNFWTAIAAFAVCFAVTVAVSVVTTARDERELVGLVHSLTEKPHDERMAWYLRPATLGAIVLVVTLLLNVVFF